MDSSVCHKKGRNRGSRDGGCRMLCRLQSPLRHVCDFELYKWIWLYSTFLHTEYWMFSHCRKKCGCYSAYFLHSLRPKRPQFSQWKKYQKTYRNFSCCVIHLSAVHKLSLFHGTLLPFWSFTGSCVTIGESIITIIIQLHSSCSSPAPFTFQDRGFDRWKRFCVYSPTTN